MNIDWSKAPEGATHYFPTMRSDNFWKEVSGGFVSHNGESWGESVCNLSEVSDLLIPRPTKQSYMLEVGQGCLAYEYSTQQDRESIYIGDDPRSEGSTWKAFSSITTGNPFFSDRYEFHPLKTQEEIEREDLVKRLTNLVSDFSCDVYSKRMKSGLSRDQCSLGDEDICRYIVEVLNWRPTK